MYCGSCLRDNALAAELLARGPRRDAGAPLHADADRRAERQRQRTCSSAASASTCSSICRCSATRRGCSTAVGFARRSSGARHGSIPVDPRLLGELTVSMLRGEGGLSAQGDREAHGLARAGARPDVIGLPNSLLIGLAGPLARATRRPVCVTLQGEDLFLEGLDRAVPHRRSADPRARRSVEPSSRSATTTPPSWRDLLDVGRRGSTSCRSASRSTGHDRGAARDGTAVIGYFARVAPEKGLHILAEAYRLLRERPPAAARSRPRATCAGAPGYLEGIEPAEAGPGASSTTAARSTAPRRSLPPRARRVLGAGHIRGAEGDLGARGDGERRAGRPAAAGAFPEIIERTGGGLLVPAKDPGAGGRHRAAVQDPAAWAPVSAARPACAAPQPRPRGRSARWRCTRAHPDGLPGTGLAARSESADLSKGYPTRRGAPRGGIGRVAHACPRRSASIVGPSGSGKSTLLYMLGALERPSSGTVTLDGQDPFALGERELAAFRNRSVGFVFQDHLLLPQCSVLENVLVPTLVDGRARRGR